MTVQVILVLHGYSTICSEHVVNIGMSFPGRCITISCSFVSATHAIAAILICSLGSALLLEKTSSVYSDRVTVV